MDTAVEGGKEEARTSGRRLSAVKRALSLLAPDWKLVTAGGGFLLLGVAVNLALPQVIRWAIDETRAGAAQGIALSAVFAVLALFAAQSAAFLGRAYFFGVIGHAAAERLRGALFARLIEREISYFDRFKLGDLLSRVTSDVAHVQEVVSTRLSVLVRYGVQVAIGAALMVAIAPRLAFAVLALIALVVGVSLPLGRALKRITREQARALGETAAAAEEAIGGIRTVKAFSMEPFERRRFGELNAGVLRWGKRRAKVSAVFQAGVSFLLNVGLVLSVVYGVSLVRTGVLTTGDLSAFLLYGVIVGVSFAFFATGYAEFVQAAGAAERLDELGAFDGEPAAPGAVREPPPRTAMRGAIEFRNVSFRYPSRPDVAALANVAFRVAPGAHLAVVGPSGAGKSTLMNLLLRFYDPDSGEILIDGRNIRDLEVPALRSLYALVPQDPALFGVSIAENVRYGRPGASDEEVAQALERAQLGEFVRSLPEGMRTPAGERGVRLSGGQRQRIAIARAILRDPLILLLDEATSALDSESEQLVRRALDEALAGRTAIIIAHRLATVRDADAVVVLDRGTVVQQGTHEELTRAEGLYRQFVELQSLDAGGETRVG